jgi:hypothetical protein
LSLSVDFKNPGPARILLKPKKKLPIICLPLQLASDKKLGAQSSGELDRTSRSLANAAETSLVNGQLMSKIR